MPQFRSKLAKASKEMTADNRQLVRKIEQTLQDARREADDQTISRRTYREMTRDARARNWDIFSPKWEYFLKRPALPLQCLCALSSGIAPYFADPIWLLHHAMPNFDGSKRDEDYGPIPPEEKDECDKKVNKIKEFSLERLSIAKAHLAPCGELRPVVKSEVDWLLHIVKITDFVRWAKGMKWDIPDELNRLAWKAKVRAIVSEARSRALKIIEYILYIFILARP
jgi:hypothetical protein